MWSGTSRVRARGAAHADKATQRRTALRWRFAPAARSRWRDTVIRPHVQHGFAGPAANVGRLALQRHWCAERRAAAAVVHALRTRTHRRAAFRCAFASGDAIALEVPPPPAPFARTRSAAPAAGGRGAPAAAAARCSTPCRSRLWAGISRFVPPHPAPFAHTRSAASAAVRRRTWCFGAAALPGAQRRAAHARSAAHAGQSNAAAGGIPHAQRRSRGRPPANVGAWRCSRPARFISAAVPDSGREKYR